jgi:hypothetical protein
MNDRNQAKEWDEAAHHLVRAHGADPDRLLSLALPLNQLKWVHFDTHAALEIAGLQPPAGHAHRELPDPGLDERPDEAVRFRPFRSAPSGPGLAATYGAHFYADYRYTGLPQTGMVPPEDARDVAGRWASMAVEALGEYFAVGCPKTNYGVSCSPAARAVREYFAARGQANVTAGQAIAEFRDGIKAHADRASAAWLARNPASAAGLARSSFPGQVQAGLSAAPASPGASRGRQGPSCRAHGRRR